MGLVNSAVYDPNAVVWEVWSVDSLSGAAIYGKHNVIQSPVYVGQTLAQTRVFYDYPPQGLERNQTYYLWIANQHWDGLKHGRAVNYYAYVSFVTY